MIVRHKDRVVSKSACSAFILCYLTVYYAFEQIFLSIQNKCYNGTETGFAVFHPFHFPEKFFHIGFRIMSGTGIAGRIYTGSIVQRFYFEAGIVGKAVVTEFIFNVTSFLERITFQGIGCFRYVIMTIDGS